MGIRMDTWAFAIETSGESFALSYSRNFFDASNQHLHAERILDGLWDWYQDTLRVQNHHASVAYSSTELVLKTVMALQRIR
jgi:hypothetical protein